MQSPPYRTARRGWTGIALAALLAACATAPESQGDIASRAQARWDALLAEEFDVAYGFLSPGYRSSVSRSQYQRSILLQKVRWASADYRSSECDENRCTVTVSVDYLLVNPVPGLSRYRGTKEIEERWIRADGQWWYVPDK